MRRNMKPGMRRGLLAALVMILLLMLPLGAQAAFKPDMTKTGSLTIRFVQDGHPIREAVFKVYRVAEMSEDLKYTLTDDFAGYQVELNGLDSAGWSSMASMLAGYAQADKIPPLATLTTDANGRTGTVSGLSGLYLLVGTRGKSDGKYYSPEPAFVTIPTLNYAKDQWEYDVVVSPKPVPDTRDPVRITVRKVWKDPGWKKERPEQVTVWLLRDGERFEQVTLSKENNWTYTWEDLSPDFTWTVIEDPVPEHYKVTITQDGVEYVIKNTRPPRPDDDEHLPQTGLNWWPVWLLAGAGMLLFVIGWIRRRESEE